MKLTWGEIIYHILKPAGKVYLQAKYNLEVESNPLKDIRHPYLLLGHHVHNADPVIDNAMAHTLIRYIAGDANQDDWLKRNLLHILESVPFAKNRGDAKAIRDLMKHVKAGHPIGLYPEGGRNWDGATDYLIPSTAKLIKLFKIPVYAAFHKGGFLTFPRWATYPRRGKIVVEIKQIFDQETIAQRTAEELYELLVDKLDYNEFEWQKANRVPFKGKKIAEHIERLLYLCPACKGVNSHKSEGDKFHCTQCPAQYTVNVYGDIEGGQFRDTVSWNKWQREQLPRVIQEGFSFTSKNIPLQKVTGSSRENHLAELIITQDKLILQANARSEEIPIQDLISLSITFNDTIEFYLAKTKYRLIFDPRQHMSIKLFYDLLATIKGGKS